MFCNINEFRSISLWGELITSNVLKSVPTEINERPSLILAGVQIQAFNRSNVGPIW